MDDKLIQEYLERGISALESLTQDPVIQMETGPPVCPHCERMNPRVRQQEAEGMGLMGEIVYRFHCLNCNQVFFGVPIQWSAVKTTEEAALVLNERAELSGYNG